MTKKSKETSKQVASKASELLRNANSANVKSVSASALSQTPSKRKAK